MGYSLPWLTVEEAQQKASQIVKKTNLENKARYGNEYNDSKEDIKEIDEYRKE